MTVEVLVATAIVLLVGTVAIASFGSNDGAKLRDETASVSLLLQQARVRALETGRSVEIAWNAKDQILSTAGGGRHVLDPRVTGASDFESAFVHPSGESSGFRITLSNDIGTTNVEMNWLTGKVRRFE